MKNLKNSSGPLLSIIFMLLLLINSCSNREDEIAPEPEKLVDVYVSGLSEESESAPFYNVTIWKNGVKTILTDGKYPAFIGNMCVAGNDVYIVGNEENSAGKLVAKMWKNFAPTVLTDGTSNAFAIDVAVSGSDVYVLGAEYEGSMYRIKLWKNGVVRFKFPFSTLTTPSQLFVQGADVYVVGSKVGGASYWKLNDVGEKEFDLPYLTKANSIYVSGTDIYVAGSKGQFARYAKNGVFKDVSDGTTVAAISSMYFSGNDMYMTGHVDRVVQVWKNDIATSISGGNSDGKSIFVKNNDVYVLRQNGNKGLLYKNGQDQNLEGCFGPTSVIVVDRK